MIVSKTSDYNVLNVLHQIEESYDQIIKLRVYWQKLWFRLDKLEECTTNEYDSEINSIVAIVLKLPNIQLLTEKELSYIQSVCSQQYMCPIGCIFTFITSFDIVQHLEDHMQKIFAIVKQENMCLITEDLFEYISSCLTNF